MSSLNYFRIFGRSISRRPKVALNVVIAFMLLVGIAIGGLGLLTWGGISIATSVGNRLLSNEEMVGSTEQHLNRFRDSIGGIDLVGCGVKLGQMVEVSTWLQVPLKENLASLRLACFGPVELDCAKDLSCGDIKFKLEGVSA
jgi:hypothetical protein